MDYGPDDEHSGRPEDPSVTRLGYLVVGAFLVLCFGVPFVTSYDDQPLMLAIVWQMVGGVGIVLLVLGVVETLRERRGRVNR